MSVFDYEEQKEQTDDGTPIEGESIEELLAGMTLADKDVEERSVVDSGHNGYQKLRVSIPKRYVTRIEMTSEDDVIMRRVGDDGILMRVV